jgi:hypothetical protein
MEGSTLFGVPGWGQIIGYFFGKSTLTSGLTGLFILGLSYLEQGLDPIR